MTRSVQRAGIDAWVDEAATTDNHGDAERLQLQNDSGARRQALLFFPRPFAAGSVVQSATLHLFLGNAWPGSTTVTVKRVTSVWREMSVNWTKKAALTTTTTNQAMAIVASGVSGDEVLFFDLAAMMQDVAAGGAWFGLLITVDTNGQKKLHSAETTTDGMKPWLEVVFKTRPAEPTDLAPSDEQVVSTNAPTLTWTFTDPDGPDVQDAFQVQSGTNPGLPSPTFDSGVVTGPDTQLDLSTTSFTPPSADDLRYWRVKVRDSTGMWSPWSDIVSWQYHALPTVTVNSPTTVVEETTPPIDWTVSGGTQAHYEAWLYRADTTGDAPAYGDDYGTAWGGGTQGWGIDYGQEYGGEGWTEVYHWHREATASTRIFVPPKKIRHNTDNAYKIRLRVWDDRDRQGVPGHRQYREVEEVFSFHETSAAAAVLTLTATTDDLGVRLQWTRAAEPDFWAIKVNNTYIEDRIYGGEPFVTGTTYRWTVHDPVIRPLRTETYEVVPVVIDSGVRKHRSPGNATVDYLFRPAGVWVVEHQTGHRIQVLDKPAIEIAPGISATDYTPLGRRDTVRIVDSVRGYEGTVSGIVEGLGEKGRFERFIGNLPETRYRIIAEDMILNVELADFTGPTPVGNVNDPPMFRVSLGFREVDDFVFRMRQ